MRRFWRKRTVREVRGYIRALSASYQREKECAARQERLSVLGDPDAVIVVGIEAAKAGLVADQIPQAAAAYHRLDSLGLLDVSMLDLHRMLHPRHAYVAGPGPDYTIRQEIPAPRTLTWTGTDTSADVIRDAIVETEGKCETRIYRRLIDVYGHELVIDTPQRILTIKRGGTVVRAADGWVAGPNPQEGPTA